VYDDDGNLTWTIETEDDLINFRDTIARAATWKVNVKDHINPTHYQDYMPGLQWLEAMQYLPRFKNNQEVF